MDLVKQIIENGIAAVIRGAQPDTIIPIAEALLKGGVKTIEITVETPGAIHVIEKAATELGDEMLIGAGTVLDPETARVAIMAGSRFIFSPTVNLETIKIAKRYGVACIPGALTPTEILTAYENGADLIKVFPANVFGPRYLRDIHGPLPHIPLMPTGGVNIENVGDYIQAGAAAAGIGSSLVNIKNWGQKTFLEDIEQKAAQLMETVKKSRSLLQKV